MNIANFIEPSHWGQTFEFEINDYFDAILDTELYSGEIGVYIGFFCIEDTGSF